MAEEIAWLSAVDLVAQSRAGTLSPVDVTESLLGRIERLQPALNAFQFVDAEGARAAARASGARWRAGAPVGGLDGVPVTAPPVETAYHSPEFDRWRHGAPYTVPFNLTGHPGGSAPCGVTAAGLPVGVQVVGARFDEPRILRAMCALEAADPPAWPHPRIRETLAPLGVA